MNAAASKGDDFLKECMSDVGAKIPLDAFQSQFCVVCAQRRCTRSGLNNSMFDQRARNWHDTMFKKVPRADDDDPRYSNIRSKLFLPVVHEIRGPGPGPAIPPLEEDPVPNPDPSSDPDLAGGAEEDPPDTDKSPTPVMDQTAQVPPPIQVPAVTNTPFEHGMMLPGAPAPPPLTTDVILDEAGQYVFDDE